MVTTIDTQFELHAKLSEYEIQQEEEKMRRSLLGEQAEEQRKNGIEDEFQSEKDKWTALIKSMALKVKRIDTIAELEVEVFSARGDVIERKHKYFSELSKFQRAYRQKEAERVKHYSGGQRKYTSGQIDTFVLGDMAELKYHMELIERHVQFFEDTVKTVDNIIFGIKYRIDLEKWLNPGI